MKFNSESLQASFDQARSLLDRLGLAEEIIMDDIKKLETFLKSIRIDHVVPFRLNAPFTPSHEESILLWDPDTGKIMYIENRYHVSCIATAKGYRPQINYNDKETLLELPLTEAPYAIKMKIHEENKLALFLSFLTQKLHQTEPSTV